ncbi:discoidin domain-containing protein [Candidatus Sumerlaeota bacterium]|nr:discoidin domain-containing protein [Candidatus Sumerlaeota bacterium]
MIPTMRHCAWPLSPSLVATLLLVGAAGMSRTPTGPVAEEFRLVDRSSRSAAETLGVRIDTTASDLEWRFIDGASPAEFQSALARAERESPFDLVFPVQTRAQSEQGTSAATPGALEVHVRRDGTWEMNPESVGETTAPILEIFCHVDDLSALRSAEDSPTPPVAAGRFVSIVRDGVSVEGPASEEEALRSLGERVDLAPCFARLAAPYNWLAFSQRAGKVWFGCANRALARAQSAVRPTALAGILAPESLDFVAVCAAGNGSAIRWRGEWLGAPEQFPPANEIRAALCLRLEPPSTGPLWRNVLRDPLIVIQPRNVASASNSPDTLRDGRIQTRTNLNTFWWAAPMDKDEPIVLEFDLLSPRSIRCIEIHQAEAAGFSSHFNLSGYLWKVRHSASSEWTRVAAASEGTPKVVRNVFVPPVEARWWRLEIPPPSARDNDGQVVRLAEIQFWSLVREK